MMKNLFSKENTLQSKKYKCNMQCDLFKVL